MIEKTPEAALREYSLIYLQMVYEYLSTPAQQKEMIFIIFQEKHRLMDRFNELHKAASIKYDKPIFISQILWLVFRCLVEEKKPKHMNRN